MFENWGLAPQDGRSSNHKESGKGEQRQRHDGSTLKPSTPGRIAATGRQMTMFDRITFTPGLMGGRACIRGMRITVALVVNLVANGMTNQQILAEYPDLVAEDIEQALRYASFLASEETLPATGAGSGS